MYKVIVVKGQSQEIITRTCNTIDEAINVFEGCAGGDIGEKLDKGLKKSIKDTVIDNGSWYEGYADCSANIFEI